MQTVNFEDALKKIVDANPRYHRDAYVFLREALEFTQRDRPKKEKENIRHVSGNELLNGIRDYALQEYGPMALTVLDEWGIRACEDFGEIVFIMIDHHLLAKNANDSRDDFKGGYDFQDAFRKPFLPKNRQSTDPTSVEV